MASIEKRGSRWSVWIRTPGIGSGKRRITLHPSIRTRAAAEAIARELQNEWDATIGQQPGSPAASAIGWIDFASRDLAERISRATPSSKRNWIPNLRIFIERFTDFVGDVALESIEPRTCRAYQSRRIADGAGASTLRKEVSHLSSIFNRALQDGLIARNPWALIRKPPEPSSRSRPFTADEAERLFAAAPAERSFRYLFLAFTGCRPNEAQRLRWRDVDFQSGKLRLPNSEKGRTARKERYREVFLATRLFREMARRRGQPGELIFPARNNWLRNLRLDCARAGIEPHTIVEFRHAFGTWCAYLEISSHRLRLLMDHAPGGKTTDRYLHVANGAGTVPQGFPEIVTKSSPKAVEWSPEGEAARIIEACDVRD